MCARTVGVRVLSPSPSPPPPRAPGEREAAARVFRAGVRVVRVFAPVVAAGEWEGERPRVRVGVVPSLVVMPLPTLSARGDRAPCGDSTVAAELLGVRWLW